jgi:hypothetical protein
VGLQPANRRPGQGGRGPVEAFLPQPAPDPAAGVLARDAESSYLELDPAADGPMGDLLGHSITYRVAVGARAGQKVFSLQTVPTRADQVRKGVAQYAGFSLHAGIGVEAEQREKLERLTRYVSRPPVSVERLDRTAQGQVRYRLKTPYCDGTTHIVLEPLDFIARLAALVPPPRVHLTRFHGVFAAHAALRAAITAGGRGAGARKRAVAPEPPMPKDVRMNWARRLKRVFGIEIEQCARCGGRLKVAAFNGGALSLAPVRNHCAPRGVAEQKVR